MKLVIGFKGVSLVHTRLTKFAFLLALGPSLLFASTLRADEIGSFAKRIKDTVNPHFEGDQFGAGSISQTMEKRYDSTFDEPAPFDSMFGSDDVGGILLRLQPEKPLKQLRLKSATFRVENGAVDTVLFRLGTADGKQTEFRVPATIVPAAALMAADRRLVLLSLAVGSGNRGVGRTHVELAAAHPAIASHQMAYMASRLDLSLQNVMEGDGHYYILCEKAYKLSLKSFSTRDDLFSVRCRIDRDDTTPAGLTDAWKTTLTGQEKQWFHILNDFATVHRLVRNAMDHYVVGFPEDDFIQLLKKLQPIYEKHKMTKEQSDELRLVLMKF
jgi:hypothetical protein